MVLVILYFFFQGLYMKYVLHSLHENITIKRGMFYSIVEFFFSAITPSSTGGQPIQLIYMTKDKIPMRKSLITLMLNTMIFKLFFIVFGLIIVCIDPDGILKISSSVKMLFWLGLLMDGIVILVCYCMMFNQKLIHEFLYLGNKIVSKVTKGRRDYSDKIDVAMEDYMQEAKYVRSHRMEVFLSIVITFIQRICLFSIVYVIYRELGFSASSYFEMLSLQIVAQITIEGLPLPGGVGALETISDILYEPTFGKLAISGMVLNRTLSFYIPLVVSFIIIFVVTDMNYKKLIKKKKLNSN